MSKIEEICSQVPIIPVLVVEDVHSARPLAQAFVNGGLPVLEVTLRTKAALNVITEMSQVEGAIVGAGTVITADDVVRAKMSGATFGVSPGVTDLLLNAADLEHFPMLPGVASASDIMQLQEKGYNTMKFFPAEAAGGIPMLKSWAGPLPDVKFCPTGGISVENAKDYLSLNNVLCVGGSWLAPQEMIRNSDWSGIESLVKQAVSASSLS